jgi:hypothetical protein
MQITFADGTRIEVTESALDDFIRHDLKWVEFVHGRASQKGLLLRKAGAPPAQASTGLVKRCAQSPAGC